MRCRCRCSVRVWDCVAGRRLIYREFAINLQSGSKAIYHSNTLTGMVYSEFAVNHARLHAAQSHTRTPGYPRTTHTSLAETHTRAQYLGS